MNGCDTEFTITICPECGKTFTTGFRSGWGWKNTKGKNVCSYSCQRASERKGLAKRHQRVRKKGF